MNVEKKSVKIKASFKNGLPRLSIAPMKIFVTYNFFATDRDLSWCSNTLSSSKIEKLSNSSRSLAMSRPVIRHLFSVVSLLFNVLALPTPLISAADCSWF